MLEQTLARSAYTSVELQQPLQVAILVEMFERNYTRRPADVLRAFPILQ
jgi:hypothetical protein